MIRFPLLRHLSDNMRGALLLLALVAILPLLVVQAGIYLAWYRSRWSEVERENLRAAWGVAATFDEFVEDVHRQQWAIGQALLGVNPYTPEQANVFLAANARLGTRVRAWHWVNPAGKIIASSDPRAIGLDIADRPHFQEVRGGRAWAVSDILIDRTTRTPNFFVACRIDDNQGNLYGVVTAAIEPGAFEVQVVQHLAEQAAVAIFDSNGVLVYSSWKAPMGSENWRDRDPLLSAALDSHTEQSGELTLPADAALYCRPGSHPRNRLGGRRASPRQRGHGEGLFRPVDRRRLESAGGGGLGRPGHRHQQEPDRPTAAVAGARPGGRPGRPEPSHRAGRRSRTGRVGRRIQPNERGHRRRAATARSRQSPVGRRGGRTQTGGRVAGNSGFFPQTQPQSHRRSRSGGPGSFRQSGRRSLAARAAPEGARASVAWRLGDAGERFPGRRQPGPPSRGHRGSEVLSANHALRPRDRSRPHLWSGHHRPHEGRGGAETGRRPVGTLERGARAVRLRGFARPAGAAARRYGLRAIDRAQVQGPASMPTPTSSSTTSWTA